MDPEDREDPCFSIPPNDSGSRGLGLGAERGSRVQTPRQPIDSPSLLARRAHRRRADAPIDPPLAPLRAVVPGALGRAGGTARQFGLALRASTCTRGSLLAASGGRQPHAFGLRRPRSLAVDSSRHCADTCQAKLREAPLMRPTMSKGGRRRHGTTPTTRNTSCAQDPMIRNRTLGDMQLRKRGSWRVCCIS